MAKKEKKFNPVEDHNRKLALKKKSRKLMDRKIKKRQKNRLPQKKNESNDSKPPAQKEIPKLETSLFAMIKIPRGVPPITEGQTYYALNLQPIKNDLLQSLPGENTINHSSIEEKPTARISQAEKTFLREHDSADDVYHYYIPNEFEEQAKTLVIPANPWENINAYDSSSSSDEEEEPAIASCEPAESLKPVVQPSVSALPIDYSKAVIQAAPQTRDLMKELVGMVPASLQRKKVAK